MRLLQLSDTDYELFDHEIGPHDYNFFKDQKKAFKLMWESQGNQFWNQFISCYYSFAHHFGIIKNLKDSEDQANLVEECFTLMENDFVKSRFQSAKGLVQHIATVAQFQHLLHHLDSKSLTKDPFYSKECREAFRYLFGKPEMKISYVKACLLLAFHLKFGGSVVQCLRRWLKAPECTEKELAAEIKRGKESLRLRRSQPEDSGSSSEAEDEGREGGARRPSVPSDDTMDEFHEKNQQFDRIMNLLMGEKRGDRRGAGCKHVVEKKREERREEREEEKMEAVPLPAPKKGGATTSSGGGGGGGSKPSKKKNKKKKGSGLISETVVLDDLNVKGVLSLADTWTKTMVDGGVTGSGADQAALLRDYSGILAGMASAKLSAEDQQHYYSTTSTESGALKPSHVKLKWEVYQKLVPDSSRSEDHTFPRLTRHTNTVEPDLHKELQAYFDRLMFMPAARHQATLQGDLADTTESKPAEAEKAIQLRGVRNKVSTATQVSDLSVEIKAPTRPGREPGDVARFKRRFEIKESRRAEPKPESCCEAPRIALLRANSAITLYDVHSNSFAISETIGKLTALKESCVAVMTLADCEKGAERMEAQELLEAEWERVRQKVADVFDKVFDDKMLAKVCMFGGKGCLACAERKERRRLADIGHMSLPPDLASAPADWLDLMSAADDHSKYDQKGFLAHCWGVVARDATTLLKRQEARWRQIREQEALLREQPDSVSMRRRRRDVGETKRQLSKAWDAIKARVTKLHSNVETRKGDLLKNITAPRELEIALLHFLKETAQDRLPWHCSVGRIAELVLVSPPECWRCRRIIDEKRSALEAICPATVPETKCEEGKHMFVPISELGQRTILTGKCAIPKVKKASTVATSQKNLSKPSSSQAETRGGGGKKRGAGGGGDAGSGREAAKASSGAAVTNSGAGDVLEVTLPPADEYDTHSIDDLPDEERDRLIQKAVSRKQRERDDKAIDKFLKTLNQRHPDVLADERAAEERDEREKRKMDDTREDEETLKALTKEILSSDPRFSVSRPPTITHSKGQTVLGFSLAYDPNDFEEGKSTLPEIKDSSSSKPSVGEEPKAKSGQAWKTREFRSCANCDKTESRPKEFKKCMKCKEEGVTSAPYYCGKDCQVKDWKLKHKQEHATKRSN